MATISAGSSAPVFVGVGCNITITPGSGGRASIGGRKQDGDSIQPREIYSSTTITLDAGATMIIEAIGATVSYSIDSLDETSVGAIAGSGLYRGRIKKVSTSGDSFTARTHQAFIPSATSVSNGVCTITSNSHGLGSGQLINATGGDSDLINVVRATLTRTGANTFTYPCPGYRDGSVGTGPATFQITAWSQQTLEGVFTYLQRMAGGAFELVQNGGHSGYQMAAVLERYPVSLAPYLADLHIHWGYFNDCQYGVTVESSVASVQAILLKRKAQGSLCAVISALPVPSGVFTWPTLTSPLTTLTDATAAAWIVKWNRLMRDFCAANQMIFVDVHKRAADPATGYANAGWCKASDIHPSAKANYFAAKDLLAQISSSMYQPRLLAQTALDNVGADSTNTNICRFLPAAQGTGGAVGSGVTATATAWATGAIAAQRWRTNAGNLYYTAAGGTATAGNAPVHTSGSTTTADGITWVYVGATPSSVGVPQGWGVYGTGTGVAFVSLYDRTDGRKALRAICVGAANNDQIRIAYNGTASDVVAGNTLSCAALVSLSTALNTTNATPAGQNLKAIAFQHVFSNDGSVSYTSYESRGSVASASEQITEDISDQVFCADGVRIPTDVSAYNFNRFDVVVQFSGAGLCVVDVVMGTMIKA